MNRKIKSVLKIGAILVCNFFVGIVIGTVWNSINPEKTVEQREMEELPFHVYSSFINSGKNYKSTSLKVIIKDKEYSEDELYEAILKHHAKLNGYSNDIDITLFNSKEDYLEWNVISERKYILNEDTKEYERVEEGEITS